MNSAFKRWNMEKINDFQFQMIPNTKAMMEYTNEMARELCSKIYEHEESLILRCMPNKELLALKNLCEKELIRRSANDQPIK